MYLHLKWFESLLLQNYKGSREQREKLIQLKIYHKYISSEIYSQTVILNGNKTKKVQCRFLYVCILISLLQNCEVNLILKYIYVSVHSLIKLW